MEAFAIFCGMGIHNTHMYEKAIAAMAKQSVTLEVLSYHASATMDEAHRLRVSYFHKARSFTKNVIKRIKREKLKMDQSQKSIHVTI